MNKKNSILGDIIEILGYIAPIGTILGGIVKWSCVYYNWVSSSGFWLEITAFIVASIILFYIVFFFYSVGSKSWDYDRKTNYFSKRVKVSSIITILLLFVWFQYYDVACCSNQNICCAKSK